MQRDALKMHRAALRPTNSRRSSKRHDKVKFKVDNKISKDYGEYDERTRVIKINKKAHKEDGEKLIDTLVHEKMHSDKPKMSEHAVRKAVPKKLKKMSKRAKAKLYAKIS